MDTRPVRDVAHLDLFRHPDMTPAFHLIAAMTAQFAAFLVPPSFCISSHATYARISGKRIQGFASEAGFSFLESDNASLKAWIRPCSREYVPCGFPYFPAPYADVTSQTSRNRLISLTCGRGVNVCPSGNGFLPSCLPLNPIWIAYLCPRVN